MTVEQRAAAVASMGFTERQAEFLTLVALHSGYCLRRQYAAFTHQKYGKNVCAFLDGLVDQGFARRLTFRADRGRIYHLFARRLYAALGEENNRNRRRATPSVMARKLMLLDFVLARPGFEWYATEAEKRDLFIGRLGVPEAVLPQRTYAPVKPHAQGAGNTTRYWIQKLPLFLSGDPPAVNFVCLVTDPHGTAIDAFVREHLPLLRHVAHWTLHVAISCSCATESVCALAFQRALASVSLLSVPAEDLDWHTRTRQAVDRGDLRQLGVEDLRRYREISARLPLTPSRPVAGGLRVHPLPYSYEQFGSLSGIV